MCRLTRRTCPSSPASRREAITRNHGAVRCATCKNPSRPKRNVSVSGDRDASFVAAFTATVSSTTFHNSSKAMIERFGNVLITTTEGRQLVPGLRLQNFGVVEDLGEAGWFHCVHIATGMSIVDGSLRRCHDCARFCQKHAPRQARTGRHEGLVRLQLVPTIFKWLRRRRAEKLQLAIPPAKSQPSGFKRPAGQPTHSTFIPGL